MLNLAAKLESFGESAALLPPTMSSSSCCGANMAHVKQSKPDSGLGFHVKALAVVQGVPSSLGSGLTW